MLAAILDQNIGRAFQRLTRALTNLVLHCFSHHMAKRSASSPCAEQPPAQGPRRTAAHLDGHDRLDSPDVPDDYQCFIHLDSSSGFDSDVEVCPTAAASTDCALDLLEQPELDPGDAAGDETAETPDVPLETLEDMEEVSLSAETAVLSGPLEQLPEDDAASSSPPEDLEASLERMFEEDEETHVDEEPLGSADAVVDGVDDSHNAAEAADVAVAADAADAQACPICPTDGHVIRFGPSCERCRVCDSCSCFAFIYPLHCSRCLLAEEEACETPLPSPKRRRKSQSPPTPCRPKRCIAVRALETIDDLDSKAFSWHTRMFTSVELHIEIELADAYDCDSDDLYNSYSGYRSEHEWDSECGDDSSDDGDEVPDDLPWDDDDGDFDPTQFCDDHHQPGEMTLDEPEAEPSPSDE